MFQGFVLCVNRCFSVLNSALVVDGVVKIIWWQRRVESRLLLSTTRAKIPPPPAAFPQTFCAPVKKTPMIGALSSAFTPKLRERNCACLFGDAKLISFRWPVLLGEQRFWRLCSSSWLSLLILKRRRIITEPVRYFSAYQLRHCQVWFWMMLRNVFVCHCRLVKALCNCCLRSDCHIVQGTRDNRGGCLCSVRSFAQPTGKYREPSKWTFEFQQQKQLFLFMWVGRIFHK